ncbi:hypothetical protein RQP46_001586 [Phenoliferia psychrophenolica]
MSATSNPADAWVMFNTYIADGLERDEIDIMEITGPEVSRAMSVADLIAATGANWKQAGRRLAQSEYLFQWTIDPLAVTEISIDQLKEITAQSRAASA